MIEKSNPYAVVITIDSMPGLQTARILAAKNIPVIAFAKDKNHHSCKTNVCEKIIISDTESKEFIEKLIEIGPGFSQKAVLFPCQDTDVLLVSRNRSKLSQWYHIALPEESVVEMLMDKMKFYSFAEKKSFPVPKTFVINNKSDLVNIQKKLDFPCLLKPTIRTPEWIANSSIKAFKIDKSEQLSDVYEKHKNWTESFVVQQWLEGDDTTLYSCNCYFNRQSQSLATFIARKIRQWPPRTGQSCLGEECRNDEVLSTSLEIFKAVNYFGLGYIEMKYDQRTKKHYVIEPNIGRPTGRSAIAEAGGVELLYTKYCDLTGKQFSTKTQKYGSAKWIHILRDLQSALFYFKRGELTFWQWLKSIRGKKSYAIFSWRDPLPFVSAAKTGFFEILKSNKKKITDLEYKIVDPLTYDKWDEIVLGFKEYSIFHSSAWVKVLKDTYNYTPKSFVFYQGESVKGIVPVLEVKSLFTGKRGVSLPFSDHCDLLLTDDLDLQTMVQNIIKFAEQQKWDYTEFRSLEKIISTEDYSNYYFGHILDLSRNVDDIYSGMKDSNKRNIKKAIKENVQIEFSNTLESLKEYYRLHSITRKRQGVPPQSFEFFNNIFKEIISSGNGNIVLALVGNEIIAGAIFIHFGKKVVYKFGASDYKFQNTRANNLLFWQAIKFYSGKGYKSLDYGRTDSDQEGLRKFKLGWGTSEKKITYFRYDTKSNSIIDNSHSNAKLQTRIFNLMPEEMLKLIGTKLYRHMG